MTIICNSEASSAVFKARKNLVFQEMALLISSRAFGHSLGSHIQSWLHGAEGHYPRFLKSKEGLAELAASFARELGVALDIDVEPFGFAKDVPFLCPLPAGTSASPLKRGYLLRELEAQEHARSNGSSKPDDNETLVLSLCELQNPFLWMD